MKRITSLFIIFIAVLLLPTEVLAVDYSIEKMDIDVQLEEEGDVHVTETQTYNFAGSFNGISRTLIPEKDTQIVDVQATENNTSLEVEQDDNLYHFHRSGEDETITITTTYTIENGLEVYSDVAQFYWPFFDVSNESTYEQFNITVHPPETTSDVIAFGYDAAEDTVSIQDDGTVHFSMGEVPSGVNGDIRVAYDQALFPGARLTSDQSMKGEISADKQELADKKVAFENRQEFLSKLAPFIIGFFTLYVLILLVYAWRKRQMTLTEVERSYSSPFFVPEETMSLPATIAYSRSGAISTEVLTASVLDLVRKGFVKQAEEDDTFHVVHRNTDYYHETLLIEWLFDEVGHEGVFKVEDLHTYTDHKSNLKTYQEDYQAWQKAVQDEIRSNGLHEKHTGLRWIVALSGLALIPLLIIFAVHNLPIAMLLSIVLLGALMTFAILFKPRTVPGVKIKKEWDDFREKYSEFDVKEWTELADDEQKRAFIYGFGVNDKDIKLKNELIIDEFPLAHYADVNPMFFILFATTANASFGQANTVAASSISSGDGIAGGGAGVGGGGGGSGAF